MNNNEHINRESEDWIKTIDENKGYSSVDVNVFKSVLRRMHTYEFCKELIRNVCCEHNVLEAGCGWATSSFVLASNGVSVTAIDISQKLIEDLKALQMQLGGRYVSNLKLMVGDIFRLKEVNDLFDVVFSDGTYEHFLEDNDRKEILKNVRDVLKDNGKFIVAVPNLKNPFFDSVVDQKMPSMFVFTPKILSAELEDGGFKVIKTGFTFVNPGFEQWVKKRWMILPIRFANVIFRFLPRPLKAILAAHLFCVAQKV
ncbi:MAG: class I SAM-dependent methyltransferase [Kiritimatiellales bacterium]|nr:class I SAM-dependent methyltransferase [Kiritimatiellales bacterium]